MARSLKSSFGSVPRRLRPIALGATAIVALLIVATNRTALKHAGVRQASEFQEVGRSLGGPAGSWSESLDSSSQLERSPAQKPSAMDRPLPQRAEKRKGEYAAPPAAKIGAISDASNRLGASLDADASAIAAPEPMLDAPAEEEGESDELSMDGKSVPQELGGGTGGFDPELAPKLEEAKEDRGDSLEAFGSEEQSAQIRDRKYNVVVQLKAGVNAPPVGAPYPPVQVFQPEAKLQKDFEANGTARDRHLDSALSARENEVARMEVEDKIAGVLARPQASGRNEKKSRAPASPPTRRAGAIERPIDRPAKQANEDLAQDYLKRRASIEGLSFKEPIGYWSNSYLPGDSSLRSLHSSLATQDLTGIQQQLGRQSGLHLDAHQPAQPFDAPSDAAIAVFLQGDRAAVDGPTRMTLQVGLKGTVRGQGIRPAMNIGVVVDLSQANDPKIQEGIWSVVYALNELRDVGDRISLGVVGCDATRDLSAAQFKHGYIKVLAEQAGGCNGAGGSRIETLRRIAKGVTASDDPNAPLGSSALLLVTPRGPAADVVLLEGFAHRSAVAGMPVSVIGVGESGVFTDLERVALAGQGSRRVLRSAAEAKELVKRELAMVGGIVARAVRLRIRLAPGVKLVDVLGSERLDEARAQRVRDAEKSVDQRISRNLGIVADRGEDEEGIQIVVPVFLAADSHVVLLDVVVPGPGAVADVTVRFKDLAFLRNGIARANFSLGNRATIGGASLGALEQNVIKNRLAYETSEVLASAARLIKAGQNGQAVYELQAQRELLASFAAGYSGFARDQDLLRDIQLLEDYSALLASGAAAGSPWLSSSLDYSSKRKVLPLPRGE